MNRTCLTIGQRRLASHLKYRGTLAPTTNVIRFLVSRPTQSRKNSTLLFNFLQKFNKLPQLKHLRQNSPSNNELKSAIAQQQQHNQLQKDVVSTLQRRIPIFIASMSIFIAGNVVIGTITHLSDDYFPYYPLPFAFDVGIGPSMIPTMYPDGRDLFLRDCWSDRFFWFDWNHIIFTLSDRCRDASSKIVELKGGIHSFKRPWQRGDVVCYLQPDSNFIACKRIIGVEGDTVQLFGQYAKDFNQINSNGDFGVTYDERYPQPYCRKISKTESGEMNDESIHKSTIIVPPNHVWLEGDNPLYSTDSRHFGPLPIAALRGRVVLRVWPIRRENNEREPENVWCRLSNVRPKPILDPRDLLKDGCYGVREMNHDEIARLKKTKEYPNK